MASVVVYAPPPKVSHETTPVHNMVSDLNVVFVQKSIECFKSARVSRRFNANKARKLSNAVSTGVQRNGDKSVLSSPES